MAQTLIDRSDNAKAKIKPKAVSLLSGGLDSTVLAYDLMLQGFDLYTLSFNYGQRHKKELSMALETANYIGAHHKEVDITSITQLISNSALTGNTAMPHEHYTHENQKVTVVPNRNAILLNLAVGYAVNIGAESVFYAAHYNDEAIYPDCREEFVRSFSQTAQLATDNPRFKVSAPYVKLLKADLVAKGHKMGVRFANTWSCYEGQKYACGQCATCQERIEAFKANNLIDPILYRIPITWR